MLQGPSTVSGMSENKDKKLKCFWDSESLDIIDESSAEDSMESFSHLIFFSPDISTVEVQQTKLRT